MFALAGVWRHWYSPNGKSQMDSFAVITTEPNELLIEKTGHDRMPSSSSARITSAGLSPAIHL